MSRWSKISLLKYQQLDLVQRSIDMPDDDIAFYYACVVYDLTPKQIVDKGPRKAMRMVGSVRGVFESPIKLRPISRVGKYVFDYNVDNLSLGQFIDLSFFFQQKEQHAHLALASISRPWYRKYSSEGHKDRADYFLTQPVEKMLGIWSKALESMSQLTKQYNTLFGLDTEMYNENQQSDRFNKRYGWIYSATEIAEHERISLDEAMNLPIRQALNDLGYLKEKGRYMAEQQRKQLEMSKTKANV